MARCTCRGGARTVPVCASRNLRVHAQLVRAVRRRLSGAAVLHAAQRRLPPCARSRAPIDKAVARPRARRVPARGPRRPTPATALDRARARDAPRPAARRRGAVRAGSARARRTARRVGGCPGRCGRSAGGPSAATATEVVAARPASVARARGNAAGRAPYPTARRSRASSRRRTTRTAAARSMGEATVPCSACRTGGIA